MYDIYISFDNDLEQNTQVGEVCGKKLKHPIPIILSNEYLQEKNFRDVMVGPPIEETQDKGEVWIYVSANQVRWLQSKDRAAEFPILHEIGHIILGHLSPSFAEIKNNRLLYIKLGTVSPVELAADQVAYKELGAEPCIKALTKSMNERMVRDALHCVSDGEKARMAIIEYQRRISVIEALGSKKKKSK